MLGAECSECCGGWYCDSVACWQCDLATLFAGCSTTYDASCQPAVSCKTMIGGTPCGGSSVSIEMSGWSSTTCDYNNTLTPEITQFNGTYATTELCGRAGVFKTLPSSVLPYGLLQGSMTLNAGFARLSFASNAYAAAGYVTFQVKLGILLQYNNLAFYPTNIRFNGFYESNQISIDSLSSGGNWLSGRSVAIDCAGTGDVLGAGQICTLPSQSISISFQ